MNDGETKTTDMAGAFTHTLNTLAAALRGMPRDALILMRLPSGEVRHVELVSGGQARDPDRPGETRYAIILEAGERAEVRDHSRSTGR